MTFDEALIHLKAGRKIRVKGSEMLYTPYQYFVLFDGDLLMKQGDGTVVSTQDGPSWSEILEGDWEIVQ